jgi:hypothetical protein
MSIINYIHSFADHIMIFHIFMDRVVDRDPVAGRGQRRKRRICFV